MDPLRSALPSDAEAASALVQRSFAAHVAAHWSPSARAHFHAESSAGTLRAALQAPAVALLWEGGHGPLGFLLMRRPGVLDMLFVDSAAQHQGIARALWTAARGMLEARHAEQRTVELNAAPDAVPAYRRLGFAPLSSVFDRDGARAVRMACWLPARALHAEPQTPERVVRRYWDLMATNDFGAVAAVLASDFTLDWPQSGERIRGAERYARMNTEYPAHGPWRFTLNRLLAQGDEVFTEVDVDDGTQHGRALSCFTLAGGRIRRIVEYWPDPFPAPAHRAHLVERIG
jgi:GNAT superfamily N-acetyltransferase/ketosteroid isomerase-like protein